MTPEQLPPLTVERVRYMIESAWCAGYYDADYTHDSAYASKKAEECADQFLGPAAESPEPLTMPTDEQVDARILRIMEAGGLTTNLGIRARAAIAEFCRLNNLGAPHD
jgi:hypothetical protein